MNATTRPTQEQLEQAFNRVRNQDDWRAPIDYTGEFGVQELHLTLDAIEYFTATKAEVMDYTVASPYDEVNGTKLRCRITAVGYRMGPAGP